ncbi:MAG: hypothetical protein LBV74_18155 [Tannerella sp.]|jgi:hypothetical protein|nr:hypothetical protein [Tannerella sp.]
MSKKLCVLVLLFFSLFGGAQEKVLKGVILKPGGTPVSSIYIYDETAQQWHRSDSRGAFTLNTKKGNVLFFDTDAPINKYIVGEADSITVIFDYSYVHGRVCLVIENADTSLFRTYAWGLNHRNQSDSGVGIMEDHTPVWLGNLHDLLRVYSLDLLNEKDNQVEIKRRNVMSRRYARGFEINLKTSAGFNSHMALPKLQSAFAQGRAEDGVLQWFGADKNELFSWGPAVHNLEYSGTAYDYDLRGALVPAGTGNGIVAGTYGARDFFRTGFYTDNSLQVLLPGLLGGYVDVDLGQKLNESPMRNSDYESYNFSLALKNMRLRYIKMDLGVTYNLSEGHLLNRGANLSSVLAALYTTPATFDNNNGLTAKQAVRNASAFSLPSGTLRSYAPDVIENPYGLLNKLPDREKNTQFMTYASLKYRTTEYGGLKATLDLAYNKYTDYRKNAWFDRSIIFDPGLLTIRDAETENFRLSFIPSWQFKKMDRLTVFTGYVGDYQKQHLVMNMENPFSASRFYHEVKYGARFSWYGDLNGIVDLSGFNYFSNTIDKQGRFLPYAGITLDFSEYVYEFSDYLKLNANAGMSLNEVPLIYDNSAVLSTGIHSSEFFKYRENQYLGSIGDQIKPEIKTEYQAGISMGFFENKLNVDVEYYNATTRDYMAPILATSGIYALDNVAKINNSGIELSLRYNGYRYSPDLNYKVELHFSKPKSNVIRLNNSAGYIPVAGFSNVFTALTEGQPIGVIYGTRWERDDYGNRMIGEDGFPLVDARPALIGDPTPDFISSLYSVFNWKNLSFSFTFEYHHGGERWNGTQAWLDYAGVSQNSAEQRNITDYVFEGVNKATGQVNTTPVDFYNPVSGLNRWVRYGPEGVGEDYIQDADFLRLSNIALFYDLSRAKSGLLKNLSVGVSAANVFVLTKYEGSDPASQLFNYNTAKGLDLFNMPGVRSYLLTVKMKINK